MNDDLFLTIPRDPWLKRAFLRFPTLILDIMRLWHALQLGMTLEEDNLMD
jgi:hypothetical protein